MDVEIPAAFILAGVAIFGLLIGSFLSACIYRIPLGRDDCYPEDSPVKRPVEKVSLVSPARSFCPHCLKQLAWWHNIPVLSWFLLRGRCWFCKASISARYPLVELLSCGAAVLSYTQYGLTPTAIAIYAFTAALIVISFIDYDFYIIPDIISKPGAVIGFGLACLNEYLHIFQTPMASGILASAIGLAFGSGFLWLVAEVYFRLRKVEGLGLGDVKLLAMTGAFFGIESTFYTIFVGSLLGSVCGITMMLVLRRGSQHPIPFGPYLAVGTVLYLFASDALLQTWMSFIMYIVGGSA